MALPTNRVKKIKLANNTEYEIIPERLQNSGFSASLPTLSADATLALTSDIPTKTSDLTNDSGYTSNTGTITSVQLNGSTVASSGVANVQALPNFSLNINHGTAGNPRQVKFLTVDYNTKATYFKMSATSCHDNGTSYQFLEDIIIGCTTGGTVVCNVYKYCQQAVTLDNVARNYGDVFYVIDTTNKIVDFYILCGQYASSQFTPATKIGNTTIAYITQYTGTATYYSSGTKVWADGDSTTYARLSDIPTNTSELTNDSGFLTSHLTSINGLAGGQLTSALYLAGGDAVSGVANIQLDTNGQITAKGTTSTLFGRTNSTTLLVGHSSHALNLRGSATRPTYNGNSLALSSDIPSAVKWGDMTLTLVATVSSTTSVSDIMTDGFYLFVPYASSIYFHYMYLYTTASGSTYLKNNLPFVASREPQYSNIYVAPLGLTNSSAQSTQTVYRVNYCKVYSISWS